MLLLLSVELNVLVIRTRKKIALNIALFLNIKTATALSMVNNEKKNRVKI